MVILIAAGHDKFNISFFQFLILRHKTCMIVFFGVVEKSSVHISDDNFDGHTCSWLITATRNILITM